MLSLVAATHVGLYIYSSTMPATNVEYGSYIHLYIIQSNIVELVLASIFFAAAFKFKTSTFSIIAAPAYLAMVFVTCIYTVIVVDYYFYVSALMLIGYIAVIVVSIIVFARLAFEIRRLENEEKN